MKKIFVASAALILFLTAAKHARAQFTISPGSQFSMTGNLQLTLSNTDLVNNGTFSAGTGAVSFSGSAPSNILGSQAIQFYELKINKSAGVAVMLQTPVAVSRQISFSTGVLDLNGHDVDLGSTGMLNGEQETSRILGSNGGEVIFNGTLNAPSGVNPGNLGILISSPQNLGNTVIRRGHQSQTNGSGAGSSVLRYYDIAPANNSGLNATLRFQYFDAELNGQDENALILWERTAAQTWTGLGFDSRNTSTDYVEKTGIASLERFTLSAPGDPLPVIFTLFNARCEGNRVLLVWQTAQEENSHYFSVERSADAAEWTVLGKIPAAGNASGEKNYSFADDAPLQNGYYRIAEHDLDGRVQFTSALTSNCNPADAFRVWPNPARSTLYINISADAGTAAIIKLSDSRGARIRQQTSDLFPGNNLISMNLQGIAAGIYFVSIQYKNKQVYVRKIIKE
ncbi:MAG: T9SS type A sorting domain-containing protein [Bacteroidota bacterium]|nr:T9SS type A sorting domain-containing protein [Bacteroidota bacterium]MDP4250107.1 T9SS type A sorting domain-containing protein [Bacteroidota bacterium]